MHPVEPKLVLISLLVQLGVAAAVSSSLARSTLFRRLLLAPERSPSDRLKLVALICAPLVLGVWIRAVVPNFLAADISLATVILLGIIVGTPMASVGAIALSLPAMLHREYLSLPVNLMAAAVSGLFYRFVDVEAIWSFSPMIDLSLYRWVRRNLRRPHLDRQVFLLLIIALLQLAASEIAEFYPHRYFSLGSNVWLLQLAICAATPVLVGIPLKIWNAIRIEDKLEQQARLLLEARLDALQRQINPHFLFNTLNSIGSLIRVEPDMAREMVNRLANILRILLRTREAFVPFRDELAFTDDYLGIEVVRFGEKLRVVKEIAPETLDLVVPSMLLQPLIENSIKHGLEPRISGGTVTLRSRVRGQRLLLEVEDDGVGVAPERPLHSGSGLVRPSTGIGMKNVRERMEVLYGADAVMEMESRPGRGTRITLEMPIVDSTDLAGGRGEPRR
ncbi:putative regulator of cell autolysis [Terriglobus roseus DSM 18391]|uniref:histidine kinase n=1 Tax=Terriglobus roseus (strain DSM 18391 / NRRL B-41598 / KBS 63) TaxID=926566 RepID=I3ZF01_TERRK|nr:histidine kinase [Terriglobus roseus]AFL87819.1 putative regulator of cell autolysis [Terriglobus roseus DSM 18391]